MRRSGTTATVTAIDMSIVSFRRCSPPRPRRSCWSRCWSWKQSRRIGWQLLRMSSRLRVQMPGIWKTQLPSCSLKRVSNHHSCGQEHRAEASRRFSTVRRTCLKSPPRITRRSFQLRAGTRSVTCSPGRAASPDGCCAGLRKKHLRPQPTTVWRRSWKRS